MYMYMYMYMATGALLAHAEAIAAQRSAWILPIPILLSVTRNVGFIRLLLRVSGFL